MFEILRGAIGLPAWKAIPPRKGAPTVWSDRDLQEGIPLYMDDHSITMLWVWRRCLIRFLLPAIACSCILPLASCSFSCFLASYSISCHLDSCLLASCSFASCFLPLLALAFCLLLFVPNVAFWTDKKPAPNCSLRPSKTLASPHWNTMRLKDGPRLRPAAACA